MSSVYFLLSVIGILTFTRIKETSSLFMETKLMLNKKLKENGEIFEYYEEQSVTVNCLSSEEISDASPVSVLMLYKNNDKKSLIQSQEFSPENSTTYNVKDKEYSDLNVTATIIPGKEEIHELTCSLEETRLNGIITPYKGMSKSVTFVRKTPEITTSESSFISTPLQNEADNEDINTSQGILGEIWFYPAVVGAGVVIIIIIVCIIKVSTKKTKDTEQLVPGEYDYPNETPPPNFPENTTLEETYCRPLDNSNQDNPYSTPYVPKSPEELYTVPLPKSARKPPNINDKSLTHYAQVTKSLKNKIANDNSGYESVKFTKNTKNNVSNEDVGYESVNHYAKVKPSEDVEPSYASVGVENNYDYATIGKKSNYANVFGNGRYVNTNSKVDYVEPNYCEVNTKKST